ncbi:MAG: NAD(P)H-dependent flavin oxidoreductase [Filifactoraceae bacterium]
MKGFMFKGLDMKVPIIQGGMGIGISGASLASAVAEAGGVGVISAAGLWMLDKKYSSKKEEASCEALQDEIRKAKSKTNGILGVNIMVALSNFEELSYVAIKEGIDIIFAGAGLPLKLPEVLRKAKEDFGEGIKTKLVPIISSGKAINLITKYWIEKENYPPDAFVLEGPMAGGHLGFKEEDIFKEEFSLDKLVNDCLKVINELEFKYGCKIPLFAGGGIFSGKDIKRILDKGVSAVQMGTRFVATNECDGSLDFKRAYLDCKQEDIVIIKSPVGLPGRAIKNDFTEKAKEGMLNPKNCPFHCISTCKMEKSPYCISLALANACKGKLDKGFVFIGANGYRVEEIISVSELFKKLEFEYNG